MRPDTPSKDPDPRRHRPLTRRRRYGQRRRNPSPGYTAFATAAETLATPEPRNPVILRPAQDAWMAVAHLRLGLSETDGRALAILFWPDPKALGPKAQRALLLSDPATLTPDSMAQALATD